MRKLAHLTFALAVALTQGGVAFADVDQTNERTGSDSNNQNTVSINNDVDIDIRNDADVDIDIDQDMNTGGNNVTDNTTVGDVSTGNATGTADVNVGITQRGLDADTMASLAMPDFGNVSQSNETTGSDSTNENTFRLRNDVDVDIDNKADVDVDIDCDADTGGNNVKDNTTVEDISTGDAECAAEVDVTIDQVGVGGEEENGVGGRPTGPGVAGVGGQPGQVAGAAAVGGALFAAGSSLLVMLLMLFVAANTAYFLRRKLHPAIHSLNEGKVAKKH